MTVTPPKENHTRNKMVRNPLTNGDGVGEKERKGTPAHERRHVAGGAKTPAAGVELKRWHPHHVARKTKTTATGGLVAAVWLECAPCEFKTTKDSLAASAACRRDVGIDVGKLRRRDIAPEVGQGLLAHDGE